jgi:hypothetical protein
VTGEDWLKPVIQYGSRNFLVLFHTSADLAALDNIALELSEMFLRLIRGTVFFLLGL